MENGSVTSSSKLRKRIRKFFQRHFYLVFEDTTVREINNETRLVLVPLKSSLNNCLGRTFRDELKESKRDKDSL
jgi:hypothetical protein